MRSANRWDDDSRERHAPALKGVASFAAGAKVCMNAKFGAMLGKPKRKAPKVPGPVAFHHLPSAGLWAAHVTCAGSNVSLA
jgi:hypothetical protein